MKSKAGPERSLPRGWPNRLALGCAGLFFGVPLTFGAFGLACMPMPRLGVRITLVLAVTEELLLAGAAVSVFCLIWSIATPAWVERLFQAAWHRAYVAILLVLTPLVLLALLEALGIDIRGLLWQ